MGMSMHVTGFRDLDGKFKKMMKAKQYCDKEGLSYPKEVTEYFGSEIECKDEYIKEQFAEIEIPHEEWSDDHRDGFEIEVKDIPKEAKTIRFYCSY